MKVIIAGDRDLTDRDVVWAIIDSCPFEITEVVCGKARGVDTLGEEWAKSHDIPVAPFPANWNKFHKAAGPIRNQEMAEYGEALCVLWYPSKSRGSRDMLERAFKEGLHIYAVNMEAIDN